MRIFLFLYLVLISIPQASAANCELDVACEVNNRSYHARVPDDWDGKTPLPVLLHFHGWGRQGKMVMNHKRIAGATRKMGVLLLAPNGNGRSWSFWKSGSRDVPFTDAVIEDAAKRWPIDRSRIFVSGFSYGGAMAWRYACENGKNINTVLAMAGTLRDENEHCKHPVNLRHTHGTRDTVMDYPYGNNGELEGAVTLWRNRNKCSTAPNSKIMWKPKRGKKFSRLIWSNCKSGKSVVLDVHQGGHLIPNGWIEKQLQELL